MLLFALSILGVAVLFLLPLSSSSNAASLLLPNASSSSTFLDDPEEVVLDLQSKLAAAAAAASRRRSLAAAGSTAGTVSTTTSGSKSRSSSCLTGNPIDDCWRCDPDWSRNRQRLADCGIGFGRDALGGKGGQIYTVTDSSDSDPVNPKPGTLRHAVIQDDPLWIVFSTSMTIRLNEELIMNSFKTIDGRGADVHITGGGCITLQYVSNVIIHGIRVHNCVPSGNANVRSSPTHVGFRSRSDGDGISIYGSRKIWIDHCSLSSCADGLVDAIMGSTGITISNSYFARHNDVMLMGHSDEYGPDKGMQVTIAFNVFGPGLVQRMPRCRLGYFHIVNNDFTGWGMYAIGGSADPTINSQGNRYTAPNNPDAKEVTKRVDTVDGSWGSWDWRSEGDILVNGAVFVPSGEGLGGLRYEKASSVEPKSAGMVEQITMYAGVFGGGGRDNGGGGSSSNYGSGGTSTSYGGNGGTSLSGYLGMVYGSGAAPPQSIALDAMFYLCHCSCLALSLFLPVLLRLQQQ